MRALVTGGAGFIGSTLVDRLVEDGHEVVVLDDLSTGRPANLRRALDRGARLVEGSVTDPGAVAALVEAERPEVVHHLAAQADVRVSVAEPLRDATTNVLGTLAVLDAARLAGTRLVTFASSGGSVYGDVDVRPVAEVTPVRPGSPYAAAKACGEVYASTYADLHGLAAVSLRLANVYGPRQDPHGEAGVVAIFAGALLDGRPTTVFGDGTAARDYVHVDDVVDGFVAATAWREGHVAVNVGTGVETTTRQLHTLLARVVGAPDEPRAAPARPGELSAVSLDVTRAGEVLGWTPATGLADGLVRTVAHLRDAVAA